jgi:hypothetical protein
VSEILAPNPGDGDQGSRWRENTAGVEVWLRQQGSPSQRDLGLPSMGSRAALPGLLCQQQDEGCCRGPLT